MIAIANDTKKDIIFVTNDKKETNDLYSKDTILSSFKKESQQNLKLYDFDEFIDGFLSAKDISVLYDSYTEFYMEYINDYYKKYIDNELWKKEYSKIELIDAYDSITKEDINNIQKLFENVDFKYDFSERLYLVFYVKAYYDIKLVDEFYIVFEYDDLREINLEKILNSRKKGNEYVNFYKIGGE